MSFQAYLDTIEKKTGKSPAQLRELGRERGWTDGGTLAAGVKPMAIVAVLKDEFGLGHGHAMAVVALLKGQKREGGRVTLRLYHHPFAQYCHKVLIALYEHDLPFERVAINLGNPGQRETLAALWPFAKFPVLECSHGIFGESGVIIECLDTLAPDRVPMVPNDRIASLEPRMLERVIDHYIADPLARMVVASFTGAVIDTAAETRLIATAYDFLEARLGGREWGAGDAFGLADCAAGPALFYANLKVPIGGRPGLADWFARLRARPSFARVIEEARPFRTGTPFDWPDGY